MKFDIRATEETLLIRFVSSPSSATFLQLFSVPFLPFFSSFTLFVLLPFILYAFLPPWLLSLSLSLLLSSLAEIMRENRGAGQRLADR